MLRQLNGERPHAAGTRVDEDSLPLLQVGALDQHLPGGQPHQRDGRGLFHGEVLRLHGHIRFIHGNELGERPDPILMRPRIDLVARLEPPHAPSDPDDNAGDVVAEDQRQAIGQDAA